MSVSYPYHSLEDFLVANMLTVDAQLDDGWGAAFPVKGREIEATVLFADITAFSRRTADLDPTETLTFVNNFFSWISAEAIRGRPGIVDKYIGDEIMVVFSKEFGSHDPFADAVHTARWMGQKDVLAFMPHVGIASGLVIVGYVGTPLRYGCSVFGAPVALAARCAALDVETDRRYSSHMTFPAADWGDRDFNMLFPAETVKGADGSVYSPPLGWALLEPRSVPLKNLGEMEVRQAINTSFWMPAQAAEDRAREGVSAITSAGRRWERAASEGGPEG